MRVELHESPTAMSSCDIRLRLVVRRNAVPEVKLVWPCAATEDFTIAKLLIDVSDVVPLEGGEWGLEDYAVELSDGQGGSFECLHFQKVGKVLKEGDQVIIRALSSEDLRRRRLAGRHQISVDGSHLVDGVTFGRAWRPPRDRPPLRLPPRKRLRITYDESADEDEPSDDDEEAEQLLLDGPKLLNTQDPSSVAIQAVFDDADRQNHVEFENNDDSEGHDGFEGEDADYIPNGATEDEVQLPLDEQNENETDDSEEEDILGTEDLEDELQLLKADNAILGEDASFGQLPSNYGLLPNRPIDLSWLDTISALRSAFPLTSLATMEAELKRQGQDVRRTYEALAKSNDPTLNFDEMLEHGVLGPLETLQTCGTDSEDALLAKPTRPLIEEVESFDNPVVDMAAPNVLTSDEAGYVSDDNTSSSESSSNSDSDETSESGSEEDSLADLKTAAASRGLPPVFVDGDSEDPDTSSEDSSSDDDSSSSDEDDDDDSNDDDSSDDEAGGADVDDSASQQFTEVGDEDSSSDDDFSEADSSDASDSQSEPEELSTTAASAPATTQAQQAVQPPPQQPESPKESSVLPHQGLSKTQKRNARRREAKRRRFGVSTSAGEAVDTRDQAREQELLARKQALLNVVNEPPSSPAQQQQQDAAVQVATDPPAKQGDGQAPQEESPTAETSAQRRSRIDLGAGRRLLFGALGLKNPKTKADEEKLKEGLMKDVRPLKNARIEVVEETTNVDETEEDPDWWKERINYTAVECCHEGMVLIEPPFPFVQRWDPQQQYGSMRKRKRASQNFYEDSYYEEDSQWYEQEADAGHSHKKKKSKGKKSKSQAESQNNANGDEVMELNYDDIPAKPAGEGASADLDDLPPLPTDVTSLPSLQASEVKPGMVITWKQLLLSKATNWQPQLAAVTGLVLPDSTPDNIYIVLAKRDREQSQRQYDEETGERIYGKFEVPDMDDDEDAEDDGHRDVAWAEMIEPRLVQREPSPSVTGTPSKANPTAADSSSAKNSQDQTTAKVSDMDSEQNVAAPLTVEHRGSDTSFTIKSGQQMPIGDISTFGEPFPVSTSNDSLDTTKIHAASDVANSPTRQLQETSQAAARSDDASNASPITETHPPNQGTAADNAAEAGSKRIALETVEPHVDAVMAEAGGEVPLVASDSTSKRLIEEVPDSNTTAQDAENAVGVSQTSIHSGRQVQPDYGFGDSIENLDESVIPETVLEAHATPPPGNEAPKTQVSSTDSSPFPSIEEVFHTAITSRYATSPVKQAARSQPAKLHSDPAYDEAMRRLDEGEDSDDSPDKSKTIRSLFPNATQPALLAEESEVKGEGERSTGAKSGRLRRRLTPFQIPEGSQVISLGSSPISAQIKEVYAEDSDDETYEPQASPTKEPQIAVKHETGAPKQNAKGRKKTLPRVPSAAAAAAARVLKSKQPPASARAAGKGVKTRRKTGERF
ncbi:hypothetical protein HJFPF1_04539 [Paramyrothecium foliicola]|nr:hypothetical protein HJFPF1_04539 [Paramyrothecium foliicola]